LPEGVFPIGIDATLEKTELYEKADDFQPRRFLQTSLLGSAAMVTMTAPKQIFAAAANTGGDPYHGLKMGMTSYTLRKFTPRPGHRHDQGGRSEIHFAQRRPSPVEKHARAEAGGAQKVEDAGLVLMGGGVHLHEEQRRRNPPGLRIRKGRQHAHHRVQPRSGKPWTPWKRWPKEYNLRIAIHNHGPTDKKNIPPRSMCCVW